MFECFCSILQEIRGPHDVVNLGRIFGLSSEYSRNGVTQTSEEVVSHGDIRSRTYKGILRPVDGSDNRGSIIEMEL
jgi:RNase P/RNase MRP subunit p30